jgi:proline-specific peptidase
VLVNRRDLFCGIAGFVLLPGRSQAQDWTPPEPAQESHVPVRGGSIYVRVNGDLKSPHTPVVFINGGPGASHEYYLPSLVLADQRAVILYDQLDTGLSERKNDPFNWTVERFVSEIDAIRAAFDLRHFHLVGHSWGSTVALEYAARRPAGLDSLVLGSPLISTRSWEKSTSADLARLPPDVVRTITDHEAAGTTDARAYSEAMEVFYSHYALLKPVPPYVAAYRQRHNLQTNEALYKGMWGPGEIHSFGTLKAYNGEPLLSRIDVATLFLCGEDDEMTADALQPLVARVRHAKLSVIPGAGHLLIATHADAYTRMLRDFLAAHDPRVG